ncbi:unnamed protein product [Bursaphelenchus okinawaensis]|uniref:Large ribosomal subunit protein uL29m n=1 Tax=Bursaphelenchus okinawaensis TaxID=465554 RepID=A0A811K5L9_9BILA|nr:unnamed protein product [Bursaphelenchus okinawaensis]CAG9091881.1 unnamed protein product [Bursaphelenchus okinawaensis]
MLRGLSFLRAKVLTNGIRGISRSSRLLSDDLKVAEPDENGEEKTNFRVLHEFLDTDNFGIEELRPKDRPGREWTLNELRLKSNSDLHKLWYVLLKERNMLMTMKAACEKRGLYFANPERMDRVEESMENLQEVVHERNDAVLRLETGDSASPRMRRITSKIGFTYDKPAEEHYEPFEVSRRKEYEKPYLDEEEYITQTLWNEKQEMKRRIAVNDEYLKIEFDKDKEIFKRGLRRHFKHVDHLPESVVKQRKEETQRQIEQNF